MSSFSTVCYTVPSPASAFTMLLGVPGDCLQVFFSLWRGGCGEIRMAEDGDSGRWRGELRVGAAELGGAVVRDPDLTQH